MDLLKENQKNESLLEEKEKQVTILQGKLMVLIEKNIPK